MYAELLQQANNLRVLCSGKYPHPLDFRRFADHGEVVWEGQTSSDIRLLGTLYLFQHHLSGGGFNEYLLGSIFFDGRKGEAHDDMLREVEGVDPNECAPVCIDEMAFDLLHNREKDSLRVRFKLGKRHSELILEHTEHLVEGCVPAAFSANGFGHLHVWVQL